MPSLNKIYCPKCKYFGIDCDPDEDEYELPCEAFEVQDIMNNPKVYEIWEKYVKDTMPYEEWVEYVIKRYKEIKVDIYI